MVRLQVPSIQGKVTKQFIFVESYLCSQHDPEVSNVFKLRIIKRGTLTSVSTNWLSLLHESSIHTMLLILHLSWASIFFNRRLAGKPRVPNK